MQRLKLVTEGICVPSSSGTAHAQYPAVLFAHLFLICKINHQELNEVSC